MLRPILMLAVFAQATAMANDHAQNLKVLKSVPVIRGLEKPSSDEAEIARKLDGIFKKIALESRNANQSLNRGTHAKGTCFDGRLKVLSEQELLSGYRYPTTIVKQLKKGFFKESGQYNLQGRFANAKGQRNPDTAHDVRGFAFSVEMPAGQKDFSGDSRIDFMMNSSPMFAVNNIKEFYELMKAARLAQGDLSYILNPFYLKSTLKAKNLLEEYEKNDAVSFATEEYWANLPYVHGLTTTNTPQHLVKFKTTPCDGKGRRSEDSSGKSATYLQDDIKNRVADGGVCFKLQMQFFDLEKIRHTLGGKNKKWNTSDWIENGGELWDEKALPFYTVAEIHLDNSVACQDRYVNTRLHATKELMPIGSIARVRTYVEEKSRARRLGELKD